MYILIRKHNLKLNLHSFSQAQKYVKILRQMLAFIIISTSSIFILNELFLV